LRQAALIAGFAYLLNPVTHAEYVYPKLVTTGNAEQTVQNISTHGGLFLAALFCYLVSFIGDVVIAWALYVLLAPVNRSLSLLTAWFQLGVCSGRSRRFAEHGKRFSSPQHTGVPDVLRVQSAAWTGLPSGSIRFNTIGP